MKINLCFCKIKISFENTTRPRVIERVRKNNSEFTFADSVDASPQRTSSCEFLTEHRRSLIFNDQGFLREPRSTNQNVYDLGATGFKNKISVNDVRPSIQARKSRTDGLYAFLQNLAFSTPIIDRFSELTKNPSITQERRQEILASIRNKLVSFTSSFEMSNVSESRHTK